MNQASLLFAWLAALIVAGGAAAQTPPVLADSTQTTQLADGPAIGVSLGRVGIPGEYFSITVIGIHITQLRRGSAGSEFSVYTSPYVISEGHLVLAPQWSMASSKAYGNSWIVSKIGVDAIMAFGKDASGMLPGAHVGIGVLLPVSEKTALRLDFEPHWFLGVSQLAPPVVLISFGVSSLPQARK